MAYWLSVDESQVSTSDDMSIPIRSLKKVNTNGWICRQQLYI